jgi:hypothetical protein
MMTDLFDIHRKQMLIMEEERKYKAQYENYRLMNELMMVPIWMMEAQMRGMVEALIWDIKHAAITAARGK